MRAKQDLGKQVRSRSQSRVLRYLHRARLRGSAAADRHGALARFAYEFLVFAIKQAWACLFGALLLVILVATYLWYPADAVLARYDLIFLTAIGIQIILLLTGMESWQEARVILVFHLVGTAMELFKTGVGSWHYPEASVLRIAGVPLFSGFMYASVGSYIARVWRLFAFRFSTYPRRRWTALLALSIYLNFFSHHFMPDLRWPLIAAIVILYGRSQVYFRVDRRSHRMPLVVGFSLVALFIWMAENVATFARAWTYPSQEVGWHWVGFEKFGSWFLLLNISFVLVTLVHKPETAAERP